MALGVSLLGVRSSCPLSTPKVLGVCRFAVFRVLSGGLYLKVGLLWMLSNNPFAILLVCEAGSPEYKAQA